MGFMWALLAKTVAEIRAFVMGADAVGNEHRA